MSDDDLIRRGDAIDAMCKGPRTVQERIEIIRAIPAVQVAVKPLEWIKHPSKDIWRATVGLGVYKVFGITSPSWDFDSWSDAKDKVSQSAPTIESAKAAAQADYEARIRSTLTAQPSPDVAALADKNGHWGDFIKSAVLEAENAMSRYPQPNYVISKVAEESGEVVKAAIHAAEGRETLEAVRGEMRQLIAMLFRLWVEGDQVHGLPPVSTALARVKGGEA